MNYVFGLGTTLQHLSRAANLMSLPRPSYASVAIDAVLAYTAMAPMWIRGTNVSPPSRLCLCCCAYTVRREEEWKVAWSSDSTNVVVPRDPGKGEMEGRWAGKNLMEVAMLEEGRQHGIQIKG